MKRICCYCKKEFGDDLELPPGLEPGTVTHGICPDCEPRADKEVDDYLKRKNEDHKGE